MDKGVFIGVIAGVLEVAPETVSITDELEKIEWDSLSNIGFIAEIDDRLGVSMDADSLAEAVTVADLYALVQSAVRAQ